jgi:hypothetical protein
VHEQLVPQERHHVWPLGYHGPDVASNRVLICANAHGDIHYLMEAMLKGRAVDRRTYGPGVRTLADRGYALVMAYAESLAQAMEAPQ